MWLFLYLPVKGYFILIAYIIDYPGLRAVIGCSHTRIHATFMFRIKPQHVHA